MENLPTTSLDNANLFMNESAFNVMVKRSEFLARSQIIPKSLQGKPADIMVIFMMAMELDIPPMQALNGINVIQGKPTMSPQLMLALIKKRLPNAFIEIKEGDGIVTCTMARDKADMSDSFTSKWDVEKAKKMQLISKDNYQKQLNTMLRWRAVGEAARIVFPDIISGTYLPDEFQDGTLNISSEGELLKHVEEVKPLAIEPSLMVEIKNEFQRIINGNLEIRDWLVKEYGSSDKIKGMPYTEQEKVLAGLQELNAHMVLDLIAGAGTN